jgi:hypothetical protein
VLISFGYPNIQLEDGFIRKYLVPLEINPLIPPFCRVNTCKISREASPLPAIDLGYPASTFQQVNTDIRLPLKNISCHLFCFKCINTGAKFAGKPGVASYGFRMPASAYCKVIRMLPAFEEVILLFDSIVQHPFQQLETRPVTCYWFG